MTDFEVQIALAGDPTEQKRFKAAMAKLNERVDEKQLEIDDAKNRLQDLRNAKEETKRAKDVAKQLGDMDSGDPAAIEKVKKATADALEKAQKRELAAEKKFSKADIELQDAAKKLKYQQSVGDNMDPDEKTYKKKKKKNDRTVKTLGNRLKRAQAEAGTAKKVWNNAMMAREQAQQAVDLAIAKGDFVGKTPEQLYEESQAEIAKTKEREAKRLAEGDLAAKLLAAAEEKAKAQAKALKERAAKEKYQKELDEAREAADAAFVTLDKTTAAITKYEGELNQIGDDLSKTIEKESLQKLLGKLKKDLMKMHKEAADLDGAMEDMNTAREADEAAKQKKEFEEKKRREEEKAKALAYAQAKKDAEEASQFADGMSGAKVEAENLEATAKELLETKRAYEKRLEMETDEDKANAILDQLADLEMQYMEAKAASDDARSGFSKFEEEEKE